MMNVPPTVIIHNTNVNSNSNSSSGTSGFVIAYVVLFILGFFTFFFTWFVMIFVAIIHLIVYLATYKETPRLVYQGPIPLSNKAGKWERKYTSQTIQLALEEGYLSNEDYQNRNAYISHAVYVGDLDKLLWGIPTQVRQRAYIKANS